MKPTAFSSAPAGGIRPALADRLLSDPKRWLVTGVAGFIGSNLLETLLRLNQMVVGLDNFSTGHQSNLDEVYASVTGEQWSRFSFVEGDIRDFPTCMACCDRGIDYVLHQAALGSVPRSIDDPVNAHANNVTGFLHMLDAARRAGVGRFVFATSSSVYGDWQELPKVEDRIGKPLAPYAATKQFNELYAELYARVYQYGTVGLRYFNVFGPRQDPNGPYAAVIPKWTKAIMNREQVVIYGDGETSRDFCFVANVVEANLLAATSREVGTGSEIFNIAVGEATTLNELYQLLRDEAERWDLIRPKPPVPAPGQDVPLVYREERPGDVRHSRADIAMAGRRLGYRPRFTVRDGISKTMEWHAKRMAVPSSG